MMVQLERISGWKDMLVNLLEGGNSLSQACASIGVPMNRVFNEQSLDPKFKAKCESSLRIGRGDYDHSGARGETSSVGADKRGGRIIVGART